MVVYVSLYCHTVVYKVTWYIVYNVAFYFVKPNMLSAQKNSPIMLNNMLILFQISLLLFIHFTIRMLN